MRPREKGRVLGFEHLSDAELLAILLRSGTRGRSAIELGQELLSRYGNDLRALMQAPLPVLEKLPGIGQAKSCALRACGELMKRAQVVPQARSPVFRAAKDVRGFLWPKLSHETKELLYGLFLNTKNRLLHCAILSVGGLNFATLAPRDVLSSSLNCAADGLILVHNHPSGDPTPSRDDLRFTHRIKLACELIGLRLLDHIILAQEGTYSFCEQGWPQ